MQKSARDLRNKSAQARRLAQTLTHEAKIQRLLQYARELVRQAEALDSAGAPADPGAITRQQQQQQQQQAGEPTKDEAPPPGAGKRTG